MGMRSVCGKKWILVLALLSCSGCVPVSNDTVDPSLVAESTSTASVAFEDTVLPPAVGNCLTVDATMPKDWALSGKLIEVQKGKYYSVSLSSHDRVPLQKDLEPLSLSPDHKKVALLQRIDYFSYSHLIVLNNRQEIVRSFEWNARWALPLQWLDNDRLAVSTAPAGSIVILRISSGERQEVTFPYSTELYIEEGLAKIRSSFDAYNPSLTKVIYEAQGHVFVLRDNEILPGAIIWANRNYANWANPVWSPRGDEIAVPLSSERGIDDLYIISDTGKKSQLTDFYDTYKHPSSTTIYELSWSPDSTRVAMQLDLRMTKSDPPQKIDGQLAGRLLVTSVATKQLTDYCMTFASPPIWSPDGRYLAIDGNIVDLEEGKAFKVSDDYILGWLVGDK